jgi:hypothetical protein
MRSIAAAALALVFAGCHAIPAAEREATLQTKKVCCTDVSQFRYEKLATGGSAQFPLDENSPVFRFDGNKSYLKGFEIEETVNRGLMVKSSFNGPLIGQYLHPVVLLLDRQFKPLLAGPLNMQFVEGRMFGGDSNAHMFGEIRIPPAARYIVFYTQRLAIPAAVAQLRPEGSIAMAGKTPIYVSSSSGKRIELERAPVGELAITLVR